MDDRPSMRAVYESCRDAHGGDRLRSSLGDYLDAQGVDGPDRTTLLESGSRRILTYRRMVHSRIRRCINWRIPRTAARLGLALGHELTCFLAEATIRTPYLRDVPVEFVAWAGPRWAANPEIPDFLHDLARHELLANQVCDGEGGGEPPTDVPVEPARAVRFDGSLHLRGYDWAVQRLPKSPRDRTEPDRVPTRILAYRDRGHEAHYLELSELSGPLMDALHRDRKTFGEAVQHVAGVMGRLDDDILQRIGLFLADMRERGVLLGGEPDRARTP